MELRKQQTPPIVDYNIWSDLKFLKLNIKFVDRRYL